MITIKSFVNCEIGGGHGCNVNARILPDKRYMVCGILDVKMKGGVCRNSLIFPQRRLFPCLASKIFCWESQYIMT